MNYALTALPTVQSVRMDHDSSHCGKFIGQSRLRQGIELGISSLCVEQITTYILIGLIECGQGESVDKICSWTALNRPIYLLLSEIENPFVSIRVCICLIRPSADATDFPNTPGI